jgi:glycosidase
LVVYGFVLQAYVFRRKVFLTVRRPRIYLTGSVLSCMKTSFDLFLIRLIRWPLVGCMLGVSAVLPLRADSTKPKPAAWWLDATFYEIFVRSFADASSGTLSGDGIGDLQGLIEHLDYLNDGNPATTTDLGVNALWLMPINPSPSYHGYDVTDYFDVNPQYGDLALMHRLVSEAHKRGIKIIVDLVLNHASSRHPLFLRAKADPADKMARSQFCFAPLPTELSGQWDQRVWHPSGREFYYGFFSSEMPDWNFYEPAVTAHHRRVADFWLKEVGIDGFRLDAVRYFYEREGELQDCIETKNWLRDFTQYCHAVKPDCFLVGECYADSSIIASYARAGAQDSLFEFGLSRAVFEALRFEQPGILKRALAKLREAYDGRQTWSSFLANHDQDRALTQLGGDVSLARLAAQLEFVIPGTAFIYYGEEIGMKGTKPDPDLRTPMQWNGVVASAGFSHGNTAPWHAVNPDFPTVNVERESTDPASMFSLYKRLIRLRTTTPALRHGIDIPVTVSSDRVFASLRQDGTDWVLVLANLGAEAVKSLTLEAATSPLEAGVSIQEELQGAAVSQPQVGPAGRLNAWLPLTELAPRSVYILHVTR